MNLVRPKRYVGKDLEPNKCLARTKGGTSTYRQCRNYRAKGDLVWCSVHCEKNWTHSRLQEMRHNHERALFKKHGNKEFEDAKE